MDKSNSSVGTQKKWHSVARPVLAAVCVFAMTMQGLALPQGGQVAAGDITIQSPTPGYQEITQTTDKGIINWQSFDIAKDEHVRFVQPSASSNTLNRVTGSTNPSQILGKLSANGQVTLINPNGVFFGKDSVVDVAGLTASTANIKDTDFLSGKMQFNEPGSPNAEIANEGTMTMAEAGIATLVAPSVRNDGVITAKLGKINLGGAEKFTVDLYGNGLMSLVVEDAALQTAVRNGGVLNAEGGTITMSAKVAGELVNSLVEHTGTVSVASNTNKGGKIAVEAKKVILSGSITAKSTKNKGGTVSIKAGEVLLADGNINAQGTEGGSITLNAPRLQTSKDIDASGTVTTGGRIILRGETIVQTASTTMRADGQTAGGFIAVQAHRGDQNGMLFSSAGTISATGQMGGTVQLSADQVDLRSVNIDVNGTAQGGTIHVGGTWQGGQLQDAVDQTTPLPTARTILVSPTSTFKASALNTGNGGEVVFWSEERTIFAGNITVRGGELGGNGGMAEVSGKTKWGYTGHTDASAPKGKAGALLLDPKNIMIADTGWGGYVDLANPDPLNTDYHGASVVVLGSGNIVVASPDDDFFATDAGAVYLYNGTTGALISSLRGSTTNDWVGIGGVTALSNGNYVVRSQNWGNGAVSNVGAVTWGDGSTGITGQVSITNSLLGSTASDQVGIGGVTALSNGNYVVNSPYWDNGAVSNVGAVTWGNGSTGITGQVSITNSLLGSNFGDTVGSGGVTALSNGNYVVNSPYSSTTTVAWVGAVTWGDGSTGRDKTNNFAVVSNTNSLRGSTASDRVGSSGVTALSNGNYVVSSPYWDNGAVSNVGAVTWSGGTALTTVTGPVSTTNSLRGSTANDQVGAGGVTALSNGNYVVRSPFWNLSTTVTQVGAVTWGDGITGRDKTNNFALVSNTNSLRGSTASDQVGSSGVTALSNGNYVVASALWGSSDFGAVTWSGGTALTTVTGQVTTTNSLRGSTANDRVGSGGVIALSNGNYVVSSPSWNLSTTVTQVGAVTWGDGITGRDKNNNFAVVSNTNSLVGSTASDRVGSSGVTALSNGNYVVASALWGGISDFGAVTWSGGTALTTVTGLVSTTNSLVGSTTGDQVGGSGVTALSNGNYVVRSPLWGSSDFGAVTWGNGSTGITGQVSAANSFVGSTANDQVGSSSVTDAGSGRYIVASTNYSGGAGTVRLFADPQLPSGTTFAATPSMDVTLSALSLAQILATGTNVVLQANNDIMVNSPIIVSGSTGGNLTLQAGRSILFNANITTANGNLTAIANDPGAIAAQRSAGSGDIIIGSGVTLNVGTGTATLVGQNFFNNSGSATPIINTGSGRWLIYSTAPGSDTLGGMTADFTQYSCSYPGCVLTGGATQKGFLYSSAGGSNILTITPSVVSVIYGDAAPVNLTNGTGYGYTVSGFLGGDAGVATFGANTLVATTDYSTGSNVGGTYFINYSSGSVVLNCGSCSNNYTLAYGNNASGITVDKRTLTATLTGTVSKTYDGGTTATLATGNYNIANIYNSDNVFISNTAATYNDKNVGTGKTVTMSAAPVLSGTAAANYIIAATPLSGAVGTILARAVTLTAPVVSKTYDGGTSYTTTLADSTALSAALVGGDTVTAATISYGNKNAGSGNKTVTLDSVTLSDGNGGNNYIVTRAGNSTSTILARAVTLTAPVVSKTYDGGTSYTTLPADLAALSGALVGGDSVTAATISYGNKNAGSGNKTVTLDSVTLSDGNGGNNYIVTRAGNSTSTITKAPLTITPTGQNYTYSGNTAMFDPNAWTAGGCVGSDNCNAYNTLAGYSGSASVTASDTRNAGTRDIISTGTLDFTNYDVSYSVLTNGLIIDKRALTLTVDAGYSKTYDKTTAAVGATYTQNGLQSGDSLSGGTITYDNPNAGSRTLSLNGISVNDTVGGNNYQVTNISASSTIDPRILQITTNPQGKSFGSSNPASYTYSYNAGDVMPGDSLVGALSRDPGEAVGDYTINQHTLNTNVPGNYTIVFDNTNKFKITPVGTLTVTPKPITVAYGDALNLINYQYEITGFSNGDETKASVTGSLTGTSAYTPGMAVGTPNIALNYSTGSLTVTCATCSMPYTTILYANNSSGIIVAPKVLNLSGLTATPRPYDGTNFIDAALFGSINTGVLGQTLKLSGTVGLVSANAGTHDINSIAGLGLVNDTGLASNYTLTGGSVSGQGSISKAVITIASNDQEYSYTNSNRDFLADYRGYTALGCAPTDNCTNVANLDGFSGSISLTASDVITGTGGTPRPISVVGTGGATSTNYHFVAANNGKLTITPAGLRVSYSAVRTYGSTTYTTLTPTVQGIIEGDTNIFFNESGVILSDTVGQFGNAGVYATGIGFTGGSLGGSNAGSYTFLARDPGQLTINKAPLTVTINDATRSYGQSNPDLQALIGYIGFLGSNNENNAITGGPVIASTIATPTSNPGSYAITLSPRTAINYVIDTSAIGTLFVTPVSTPVTPNVIADNTNLPVLRLEFQGVPGTSMFSPQWPTLEQVKPITLADAAFRPVFDSYKADPFKSLFLADLEHITKRNLAKNASKHKVIPTAFPGVYGRF